MAITILKPNVRWMIHRDLTEVLAIDAMGFADPLSNDDIRMLLKQRNVIGMVLEFESEVVGYMIYGLHKHRVELVRLAVHDKWRRTCVGTILLDRLKSKLSSERRTTITASVPDDNLPAHLWLRSNGFVAISVGRDSAADQYKFVFRHDFMA